VRGNAQVLVNRQASERATALRHMADAETHDVLGGLAADRLSIEPDAAARANHPADRAQGR
jgi:hypothetical protein